MKWNYSHAFSLSLLCLAVLFPSISFGAFSDVDTFDTYTTGSNLNAQGCWSQNSGAYVISSIHADTAPYSAHGLGGDYQCAISSTDSGDLYFSFFDSGDEVLLRLVLSGTYVIYTRVNSGNIEYYNGGSYVSLGAIPNAGAWNRIGIRLDNAGHAGQAQYSLDNGATWSSWDSTANGGNTVDTVRIFGAFIDSICAEAMCPSGGGGGGGGTTTTATSTGMTGSEQLLGLCVIIYFISFLGWRAIFSPFNNIV